MDQDRNLHAQLPERSPSCLSRDNVSMREGDGPAEHRRVAGIGTCKFFVQAPQS